MDKRNFLSASKRSGANFNVYQGFDVYLQYSRREDRVASLKDFCTDSTKTLLTQCLLHKYKSKAEGHIKSTR